MRRNDFEAMIRRMAEDIPAEYYDGIAEVVVSPKTLPHPVRGEIYTLGECIPLPGEDGDPRTLQSRIVLYHGSFQALSEADPAFDWRVESWETLTHELRHHLEWRARVPDLEAFDRAAEHNFARHEGDRFDPWFFLDGDEVAPQVYKVDDDYFIDRSVRQIPVVASLVWHGQRYSLDIPESSALPAYVTVDGVDQPPPGDLVLVLRRPAGLRGLLDLVRGPASVYQTVVTATRSGASCQADST